MASSRPMCTIAAYPTLVGYNSHLGALTCCLGHVRIPAGWTMQEKAALFFSPASRCGAGLFGAVDSLGEMAGIEFETRPNISNKRANNYWSTSNPSHPRTKAPDQCLALLLYAHSHPTSDYLGTARIGQLPHLAAASQGRREVCTRQYSKGRLNTQVPNYQILSLLPPCPVKRSAGTCQTRRGGEK